jgi:hypothetical protein
MTLTGVVAGDTRWSTFKLSVYLDEGVITPATIEDQYGNDRPAVSRAGKLEEGDLIELYDDAAFQYNSLPDGLPVVRALTGAGAGFVGRIITIEKAAKQIPVAPVVAIADQLSGGYLRVATVEMIGMVGMALIEARVPLNGGGPDVLAVGAWDDLVYDLSDEEFKFDNGAGTNTQFVPLTRITGSLAVDVVAPVLCGIGLQTIQKVA